MTTDRKNIKLTVSTEMYDELHKRASAMSISVPAMCCYILGEKLAQLNLGEQAAVSAIREQADNIAHIALNDPNGK